MTITNATALNELLKQNLTDVIKKLLEYDKVCLIEMSDDISDIKEIYAYLLNDYGFDDYEAERLLEMKNPLESIAYEWNEYLKHEKGDFDEFLFDLLTDDKFVSDSIEYIPAPEQPDGVFTMFDVNKAGNLTDFIDTLMEAAEKLYRLASDESGS